ncbi:MAG: hypothetical protein HZA78_02775 [Candidatus Schekmanbacteria bacterium]|nr:hypothetical protein [Candidatus Schekmanbacteria bacterium]
MKKIQIVSVALMVLLNVSRVWAHKVNIFAYAEKGTVFTEGYFPDGKAVEGGKVEVYDSQQNKLLEGTTDKDGLFSFKIPKQDDLNIVLIATMGHKNSFLLKSSDLAGEGSAATPSAGSDVPAADVPASSSGAVAETAPAKPIRHMSQGEPLPVSGILGGLGFIFGLTALIMQLAGKKKD